MFLPLIKNFTIKKHSMNNPIFTSIFAVHIQDFLKWKSSLGNKPNSYMRTLLLFDMFCNKNHIEETHISKDLYLKWVSSMTNNSIKTINNKCSVIKQLSIYLTNKGIASYIPRHFKKEIKNYTPYIFAEDQILLLFKQADKLNPYNNRSDSFVFSFPALLRTLYAMGLRIHEATSLNDADVDIKTGTILIEMSKNGQQRILPMSDSLKLVLSQYVEMKSKLKLAGSKDGSSPFFIAPNGKRLEDSAIYYMFKRLLNKCNIPHLGGKKGPHLHHLRHSFAVHTLAKQVRNGTDMYCSLPYLMSFLGHRSIEGTETYVRLTNDMFSEIMNDIDDSLEDFFKNQKQDEK